MMPPSAFLRMIHEELAYMGIEDEPDIQAALAELHAAHLTAAQGEAVWKLLLHALYACKQRTQEEDTQ